MSSEHANTALWISWVVYWAVRSRGNKRTVFKGGQQWYFWFILLAVGVALGLSPLGIDWKRRLVPDNPAVKHLGVFLCAAGLGFSVWARNVLGTNWSARPTLKEGHELVTGGPYRFVRHPIYTGLLVAMLGNLLVFGLLRDLMICVFLFAGLWIKLRYKETLMLRQFPDTYPAYRQSTKALIPWVL